MAISQSLDQRQMQSFVETTTVANLPGQVVVNPDGSPIANNVTVNITEFPAAAAASDNFANPTTTNVMSMNMVWDGATWDRAPGNSTTGLTQIESRTASSAVTSVASSATNVTILASNAARRMATVYNDSTQILYLKVGSATASTSSYTVQIAASGFYEVPFPVCTGIIDGIWASANGSARITEW